MLHCYAHALRTNGVYSDALDTLDKATAIFKQNEDSYSIAWVRHSRTLLLWQQALHRTVSQIWLLLNPITSNAGYTRGAAYPSTQRDRQPRHFRAGQITFLCSQWLKGCFQEAVIKEAKVQNDRVLEADARELLARCVCVCLCRLW